MAPDPRIKHIVVLMMENRSFDHMLGLMKAENADLRGFEPGDYQNSTSAGAAVDVGDGALYQGQLSDPGHDFADVFTQMYGVAPGGGIGSPDMSGFVRSYEQHVGAGKGGDVMKCFRPEQLPVLSALARAYLVCDAWFSSVPGPTLPNRAFAHFGSSFGRLDMSPEYFRAKPSIYQRLLQATPSKTGRIYYFDRASSTLGLTFLLSDQRSYFRLWGDFLDDCDSGDLPEYAFIEPNYKDHDGLDAADQHPDNNVLAGDSFIGEVYQALRSNDAVWKSTLLLIVWDEHGGLFDHETPPAVGHPDGYVSATPSFDFGRLGVRVPALVVSPYVEAGGVSHVVFEHASIPATVTEQFIGDPKVCAPFEREKWASTLLQLLKSGAPRMDTPNFAAPVAPVARAAGVAPAGVTGRTGPAIAGRVAAPVAAPAPQTPISALLREQVEEVRAELAQHYPKVARELNPTAVRTHADAAEFMKRAMAVLHPGEERPVRRVRKPKARPGTGKRKRASARTRRRNR